MAFYAWLYRGTDFGSALNWTDGTNVPALHPPGTGDIATIAGPLAVSITGTGTADTLLLDFPNVSFNGATLALGTLAASGTVSLPGTLGMTDGTLNVASRVDLGTDVTTDLQGGTIDSAGTFFQHGSLHVHNAAIDALEFINFGTATIVNGATLFAPDIENSGTGATVGTLSLIGGSASGDHVLLGVLPGTDSFTGLTGGAIWQAQQDFDVGVGGGATLYLSGGSTLDAGAGAGAAPAFAVGSGSAGSVLIDALAPGGGGTLDVNGNAVIGDTDLGALAITGASRFQVLGNLRDGAGFGSSGQLLVSGNGATLDVTGNWTIGDAGLHSDIIQGLGGHPVAHVAGRLVLGSQASGDGSLLVSGAQVLLSVGGDITIGKAGTGGLDVEQGATLSAAAGVIEVGLTGGTGSLDIAGGSLVTTIAGTIGPTGTVTLAGGVLDAGSFLVQPAGALSGFGTFTGGATNNGSIIASGGTLVVQHAIDGTGTLGVFGGALHLAAGTTAGQVIDFAGGNLLLDSLAATQGVMTGFAAGDTITLVGVVASSATFAAGQLALGSGTLALGSLTFAGTYGTSDFALTPSGGDTLITFAPCFTAGTRIATADGPVAVEFLRPGMRVRTAAGRLVPIRWIGTRSLDCRRHPRPQDVLPIRIAAGAFAPGRPGRALRLSPDHAVFIDDMLVPIRYLVNGASIAQEPTDRVTYYHVELPRHDVLLAEGLPCESYLDTGNRAAFANGGGALVLHPDFALKVWESASCAPLVRELPALAPLRARLLARAAALGHRLTDAPALRVLADGRPCPLTIHGARHAVFLPAGATAIRLVSRRWVPAQARPDAADARSLGIAVARLIADGVPLALDDPRLSSGWHAPEAGWRWTDGDAGLALAGVRRLEFALAMAGSYWAEMEPTAAARA